MHAIEQRLQQAGIVLPTPASPAANYIPFRIVGNMVYISGQLPKQGEQLLYPGMVSQQVTLEQGYEAARWCGIHLLAHLKVACQGDWNRVVSCVKLGGFVQAPPDFTQHPEVINGASDLMVAILGEAGRHTRTSVGSSSLPRNSCVEVDAIFQILP